MTDAPSDNSRPPPQVLQPDVSSNGGGSYRQRRPRQIPLDLRLQIATNGHAGAGGVDDGDGTGGIIASRPAFTEIQLEQTFQTRMEPAEQKVHVKHLIEERRAGKEVKGKGAIANAIVTKFLPIINTLRNYKFKEFGRFDLIAGVSVGLFLIPQSMAYALLANVRPQYGFYSSFYAMCIYFFLGSSNHISMTIQGAVSQLVGDAVRAGMDQVYPNGAGLCTSVSANATANFSSTTFAAALSSAATPSATTASVIYSNATTLGSTGSTPCISKDDANARIALTLTLMAGSVQLLLAILRMGFLTNYLSDPINKGFTCAAAMHIVVGQFGNLLGAPIPYFGGNGKFFLFIIEAVKCLIASKVNVPTIIVSVFYFAILLGVKIVNERFIKKLRIPIPIDVFVLVSSLLLSKYLFWQDTLKIAPIGEIKKGFESPHLPLNEHFTSGSGIIVNGIVLGIISYAMSITLAKTLALKHGYEIDANQEMLAYGVVNFTISWFNTFVSSAALTTTSLRESMKGKTQINSIYSITIVLLAILFLVPEFAPVPKCVLSVIVCANLVELIVQLEQLPHIWRTNRYDFFIFLVTWASIICLDLPIGLLIGVAFALATVIFRTQGPKAYLLGRLPNTDIYRNIKKHKKAEQIPGLKIFKFEGSLYFASTENFRNRLYRQVGMNPKKVLARAKAKAKREGRAEGDLDLRTDIIRSDGIKQILDVVMEEGSHPVPEARVVAQVTMPVPQEPHSALDSVAYNTETQEITSSVNVFCIIFDMSVCAFTDMVGIRLLTQIVDEFNKIGVEIYLSGCNWQVRSELRRGNFFKKRSEDGFFVTNHDAVIYALSALHKELLEDENLQNQSEASETPAENASGIGDQPQAPKQLTPSERARETRRRIRRESLRRDSAEASQGIRTSKVHGLQSLTENGGAQGSGRPVVKSDEDSVRITVPHDINGNPDANGPARLNGGAEDPVLVGVTGF